MKPKSAGYVHTVSRKNFSEAPQQHSIWPKEHGKFAVHDQKPTGGYWTRGSYITGRRINSKNKPVIAYFDQRHERRHAISQGRTLIKDRAGVAKGAAAKVLQEEQLRRQLLEYPLERPKELRKEKDNG